MVGVVYNKCRMKLSVRSWVTIVTLVLLAFVVVAAWPSVRQAWFLLGQVDVWVLVLLIPLQFLSYYAAGSMIFSYLRAKGDLHGMSHWSMARLALEFNFVNHVLPSGGAAGFSYMAWVLGRHGVSASRSTMAQLVRFLLIFSSFVILMLIAVFVLACMSKVDKAVVIVTSLLTVATIGAVFACVWLVRSKERLERFSSWLARTANRAIRFFTRDEKRTVVKRQAIEHFLLGLHDDYLAIRRERKILAIPFTWGVVANIIDVGLVWVAFWSLGQVVDPAVLFIAFGIASILGALSVTPGGAGVYEAVMVTFLATSGVAAEVAIAGTLLARVILLALTISFGYVFYQITVMKYGKRPTHS